jgi:hypothetical protein
LRRPSSPSERLRVQDMSEGEILDEIIAVIETDGASYTDGEVLDIIAEILKREERV